MDWWKKNVYLCVGEKLRPEATRQILDKLIIHKLQIISQIITPFVKRNKRTTKKVKPGGSVSTSVSIGTIVKHLGDLDGTWSRIILCSLVH